MGARRTPNHRDRGEKALELRDVEGLSWVAIRERLGPGAVTMARRIRKEREAVGAA